MAMRLTVLFIIIINIITAATGLEQDVDQDNTSKLTSLNRSLRVETVEVARFTDTEDYRNSEERTNVQGLSKLVDLDKSTWKIRQVLTRFLNKIWLVVGKDPSDVFKYLLVRVTWAKIEENKRILQWFRFVTAYRTARGVDSFPDDQLYALLKPMAPDTKLATLFESLKQVPDLKNIGEAMQNYQFKMWISQQKTPSSIAKLFGISTHGPTTTQLDTRHEILKGFTKMFNQQR